MRKRDISPAFWRDERIWSLSCDGARLVLIGVWQIADREGRLIDKPFDIAVETHAWDVKPVPDWLNEYVASGLLVRYAVGELKVLAVPPETWKRHQRPHPNEAPSKLPGIPAGAWYSHGSTKNPATGVEGTPTSVQAFQASQDPTGLSGLSSPDQGAPKAKKAKGSKKKPEQAQLPDVVPPPPPRPPTRIGALHAFFLEERAFRLTDDPPDGLGFPEAVPDQAPNWGLSAATLTSWCALFPGETDAEQDRAIKAMIRFWLLEPYWAAPIDKKTQQPSTPYPWGAFLTEGQWRKAFDKLTGSEPKAGAA